VDNTAWGYSITDGLPVRDKIFERIPSTLQLMGLSLILTVIAIPVGSSAPSSSTAWPTSRSPYHTIGYALPTFWLGLILRQIFAQQLDLFPIFEAHLRQGGRPA
jgi:peptide/nickel transport system permease protein